MPYFWVLSHDTKDPDCQEPRHSFFWLSGSLNRRHIGHPGTGDIRTTCLFCSSWLCSGLLVACQESISRKPNKPWLCIRQRSRTSDLVAPQWHRQQDQQPGLVATPKASIIPQHPANKVVTQLNSISLIPPEDLSSSGYSHIDKKILSHWTCLLTTAVTPALTSDLIWIFKSIVDHKFKWFSYPLKALFS